MVGTLCVQLLMHQNNPKLPFPLTHGRTRVSRALGSVLGLWIIHSLRLVCEGTSEDHQSREERDRAM